MCCSIAHKKRILLEIIFEIYNLKRKFDIILLDIDLAGLESNLLIITLHHDKIIENCLKSIVLFLISAAFDFLVSYELQSVS